MWSNHRRGEDRHAILVSTRIFLAAIVLFITISAFAHLFGNSAHQLGLMAFDFYLNHEAADGYPYR